MNSLPPYYPDELHDWKALKQLGTGAHAAIEDIAIKAYHTCLEQTNDRQQAEEKYFEVFKNAYNGINK